MRFTQLSSLFLLFFCGLVLSSPVSHAIAKRDSNVITILDTLKDTVESTLFQISSAISFDSANEASVAPLIDDLNNALNTASSAIDALDNPTETIDDVVALIAPVVNKIVEVVAPLQTLVSRPTLGRLDSSLTHLLTGLEGLLAGLLNLVADRISDVAALLRQLTFGLILSALRL